MMAAVRYKRNLDFLLTLIDGWIKLVWTLSMWMIDGWIKLVWTLIMQMTPMPNKNHKEM